MLWGSPAEYWDGWGLWLMWAGAGLGAVALAASLASSFVLYHVANVAQSELQMTTASLGVELERQKSQTAEADARASEANARAIEAQLALERFKAPRNLNPEQQQGIIQKVSQFAGTPFDLAGC